MADDFGFQPSVQQTPADDLGFQPIPKMPDTSGAQKMAQDNLAANDNAGKSPAQNLDTATGEPVSSWLKGGNKDTPITPPTREAYIKSVQAGTANDFGDHMQSLLHSVAPIVMGGIQRAMHPMDYGNKVMEAAEAGSKIIPSILAYPLANDEQQGILLKNFPELTAYENQQNPTGIEKYNRGLELFNAIPGGAVGGLFPEASVISPLVSPIIESAGGEPKKEGEPLTFKQTIPNAIGAVMNVLGAIGAHHIAGEYANLRANRAVGPQFPAGSGPWETPAADAVKQPIAEATKTPVAALTSTDVDQHIAMSVKDKAPSASDFKDVATVTGADEKTIQTIYKQTGIKPDEVFEEARQNPDVLDDIRAGNVPENFPIEPTSSAAPERLDVARDDATKTFNVVDKDGDHVRGGFDSHEEAQQYIDDKLQAEVLQSQISDVEKGKAKPQDVLTPESERDLDQPKTKENIYTGVDEKIESMTPEERALRLDSLNKKMEAGIITPKELGEREALSEKLKATPTELDVAGKQGEQLVAANEGRLKSSAPQKAASDGLFDVAGRGQQDMFAAKPKPNIIPPSETGKPTSLRSFLSNNGAKFNEANELISIKKNGEIIKGADALEYAHEIAKENGYLPKDEANKTAQPLTDLQNALTENGGRDTTREQDSDRVAKAKEALDARKNLDINKMEHEAHSAGIDTGKNEGETDGQYKSRLARALIDFYKAEEGSGITLRDAIGKTIVAAENFVGKLGGDFFKKLGDAYIRTFQPELMGDKALRADAFLAKFKAKGQEAQNAFYRQSEVSRKAFDRMTSNERLEWLYDHEVGRWNEEENPGHARFQAMFDAMHEAETKAIGAETGYKENYLPHQWENPDAVRKFFNSAAMVKKYGADWFKKASEFKLIQEGIRAGFKLKTDNPESMLVARQLASDNMIRTMDLLKDMESSGLAKRTSEFSIDKKINKTKNSIADLEKKYKEVGEKINDPRQAQWDFSNPLVSKLMRSMEEHIADLKSRLDDYTKQKEENKLTPGQMAELKNGFKIIGPDNNAWNIHQQVAPLWKNAMEMKGLWENQGAIGDSYRTYMQGKAIWTQVKLGLSLFHPVHVAMINLASGIAGIADHLIKGGSVSDIVLKDTGLGMGLTKETLKAQDHPAVKAWNTAPEERTPEQKQMVDRMTEGGFTPIMSARDTVHFKENFDKAIKGVGLNNLRLIGTALSLPGLVMKPFFEHWIPGMKAEIYLKRYEDALARDPSLANDAGKRGEMARQIAKDTDRTYGEMNNDVQFWNRNVRDSFNAAFISGGWKLAQIYNARGLLQPFKIAHEFAKTGEFSKDDITYQMLHAYTYTALTLALGGAINTMLGNPIGAAKDTAWDIVKNLVAPKTGENNPDGTPIRLNQPAFAKEAYNLAHEINTKGLIGGAAAFLYHQTLLPGIADTLNNRDFIGHKLISDPTDLHQWMNAGWDTIMPISYQQYEKAEGKQSEVGKVAGVLGFPMAGAYLNQTPFEQRVLAIYDEQNPPKSDSYSAKLKTELRGAVAAADKESIEKIKDRMRKEGMTEKQISNAEKPYTKKFVDTAWKDLPIADQKRLIESASPEEREKFKVKGE
jgi:hypothetical protein